MTIWAFPSEVRASSSAIRSPASTFSNSQKRVSPNVWSHTRGIRENRKFGHFLDLRSAAQVALQYLKTERQYLNFC